MHKYIFGPYLYLDSKVRKINMSKSIAQEENKRAEGFIFKISRKLKKIRQMMKTASKTVLQNHVNKIDSNGISYQMLIKYQF